MESAATKIARLDRSISRGGKTVTLQRLAVDPSSGAYAPELELVDCPAHVRQSAPQDLEAPGVLEHRVVLSSTYLEAVNLGSPAVAFGLPTRDDRIIIDGEQTNAQTINPIYYGGRLVRVNMLCRGGGRP